MSYLFNLVNFQIAGDGLSTITVEEGQYTLNVSPSGKPIFAHGILELGITHLESGICRHFLPKWWSLTPVVGKNYSNLVHIGMFISIQGC
jgi:hypothetical protein